MNRRERRLRASQERRDPTRPEAGAALGPKVPAPAIVDPLHLDVVAELSGATTVAAVTTAATLAADAMGDRLALVWRNSGLMPACGRGCSYCCTVPVSVTVPELVRLVSYARETLPADELASLKARAKANAAKTHGTTSLGYPPRLDCAFLGADRSCLVHPARPLMCRREHAMDAAQCRAGYDGAAPGKDHPIDRLVAAKLASDVVLDAYRDGVADAGLDSSGYELQEAAHIAFSDERSIPDWLEGQATFARARLNTATDRGRIPTPRALRRLPLGS